MNSKNDWRKNRRNSRGAVTELYRSILRTHYVDEFAEVPVLLRWKNLTSKGIFQRESDATLLAIDDIIARYEATGDVAIRAYLRTQLYFAAVIWMRHEKEEINNADIARYPAVRLLFEHVVSWMCKKWQTTPNVLAQIIEEKFGKELSGHGVLVDSNKRNVEYLSRVQARKYQLHFRGGRAYQYTWWNDMSMETWTLVPAESSRSPGRHLVGIGKIDPVFKNNLAGFSLSMDRRFYVADHRAGLIDEKNFFHSSYMAGNTVQCAGELLIENGNIKIITDGSGHYQPSLNHIVNALETLRMNGVAVNDIIIDYFIDNKNRGQSSGRDVLRTRGNVRMMSQIQHQFGVRNPKFKRL